MKFRLVGVSLIWNLLRWLNDILLQFASLGVSVPLLNAVRLKPYRRNLSGQRRRLDEAGLIDLEKTVKKNRTVTSVRMAWEGRYQLGRYWRQMDDIRNSGKVG